MRKIISSKILLPVLSLALVAAMALGFTACGDNGKAENNPSANTPEQTESKPSGDNSVTVTEYGNGQISFTFEVKDKDGKTSSFLIKTDKETVGAALLENGLIAGADSEYGLMVDTVNGVKYDYSADKMYWAFYINGDYAQTGVDQTKIEDNTVYSFVATKA